MMTIRTTIAAAVLFSTVAANADPVCGPSTDIDRELRGKYKEVPVSFGLQSNGDLLSIYNSTEEDTWTLVTTTPEGVSCIIAVGRRWEQLVAVKETLA